MVKPLVLLPVVAFAGLALAFFVGMRQGEQALPSTMEGRQAPAVEVTPLGDGPVMTQADLKAPGVKLVNFWAVWCQPCRADRPNGAEAFLQELGNPYAKVALDAGQMGIDWGVYGVPETFVIDGRGVVALRWAGPITEDVLQQTIRPAMAKAAAD